MPQRVLMPGTLFDGVLTLKANQFILNFWSLRLSVLLLLSTEHFGNSKLVFLQQALFTGQNLCRPLYFLPPLLRVMYVERVQRVQRVVAVQKAGQRRKRWRC